MLFTFGMSYAFWASSILGNNQDSNGQIDIGDWYDAIPIYTVDEFVEAVMTDGNTNAYILARDLDFQNSKPIEWEEVTKDYIFRGSMNGNGKTIRNVTLVDHRGIFGILEGATIINMTLDNIQINYSASNTYTSGILSGRLQGSDNHIQGIQVTNSSINNVSVLSGGLIGFISPTSGTGTALIQDITINNTTVSGGYANASYGNGGVVGTINNFNVTFENITVNAEVTSPNGLNSGGLIGATLGTSNVTINQAHVFSSLVQTLGSATTLGVGGLIGKTTPSGSITVIDTLIDESTISLNTAASAGGSGGAIGFLAGSGHDFNGVTVFNTSISSGTSTGGLVGLASQASSTATYTGITVTGSTISTTLSSNILGAGGVIGHSTGMTSNLSNVFVDSNVTSTATNTGGIIGSTTGTTSVTMSNIEVNSPTIQVTGSTTTLGIGGAIGKASANGSLNLTTISINSVTVTMNTAASAGGAGGVVGYLMGTGHQFNTLRVNDSSISSGTSTGGIIGIATQSSGTATYNNIRVFNATVSTTLNNATLGAGGIIGNIVGYTATLNDLYVEADVQSTNANVGGIIGQAASGSNTTINRAVIYSSLVLNTPGSNTDRGAGGVIGRNQGTVSANHTFFSGYLKARIASSRPYVGVLRAIGTNLTFTNSRSAEIRYFVSNANPTQLVNTATLYNNMRGQYDTYASTYTINRSSLNSSWWNSNYNTITSSSLWEYNASTYLYQLKN
jgi:hypothetical protein